MVAVRSAGVTGLFGRQKNWSRCLISARLFNAAAGRLLRFGRNAQEHAEVRLRGIGCLPRRQTTPTRPHSARISVAGSGTAVALAAPPVGVQLALIKLMSKMLTIMSPLASATGPDSPQCAVTKVTSSMLTTPSEFTSPGRGLCSRTSRATCASFATTTSTHRPCPLAQVKEFGCYFRNFGVRSEPKSNVDGA